MKAQSKKASVFEAIANVVVGIGVAFVSQLVIFNGFGIHVTYLMNLYLTLWFTAVSLSRSFILRRIFNWFTEQSMKEETIHKSEDRGMWTWIAAQLGTKTYVTTFDKLAEILRDWQIRHITVKVEGLEIPIQETEAISHLTRRYGYEKQSNGEWKLLPGFDREAWRQFCTRKK